MLPTVSAQKPLADGVLSLSAVATTPGWGAATREGMGARSEMLQCNISTGGAYNRGNLSPSVLKLRAGRWADQQETQPSTYLESRRLSGIFRWVGRRPGVAGITR